VKRSDELKRPAVIRGISRLVFDAVEETTGIVEWMHANIAAGALPFGEGSDGRTRGITGFVYASIRLVNAAARTTLDRTLRTLTPSLAPTWTAPRLDAAVSVTNGILGDHLAASDNPLAIRMCLRRSGRALRLDEELASAFENPTGKVLVLAHGLCRNDRQWARRGHDHGAELSRELGYSPVYLHYNTGRHVSENGREFATLLERLLRRWPTPVEELTIVAHSMGGLVARSACHYGAGSSWRKKLRKLVFLGTPHHGAPLERLGNWLQTAAGISPYSAPLSRLGMIRSAGVTDLRFGNLLDEDWMGDCRFATAGDRRQPIPLPDGVSCYAIAATTGRREGDLRDRLFGDGLVPICSALGRHQKPDRTLAFPESHKWIGYDMNHLDLLDRPQVFATLRDWLS
jgi:pimeloyl-ACP methyl ester carboxylesterase